MPPVTGYDPIGTVQQAILTLLATRESEFLGIGNRMFLAFLGASACLQAGASGAACSCWRCLTA